MKTMKGLSTVYLLASLLLVTMVWWGCGGGTAEQASDESGQMEESAGGGETGGEMETPPATDEVSLAAGKAVYMQRCAMCHGEDGKGDGPAGKALDPKPRDHTNGEYMNTLTDEQIKTTIMEGKGAMPPHKDLLTQNQLESVVMYVRSLAK